MFMKADNFFAQLAVFRMCWVRGRLGGGKTLLAVAILKELKRRGIILGSVANIPTDLDLHPWDDLIDVDGNAPDALIVDEIREQVGRDYAAFEDRLRQHGYHYRWGRGAGYLFDEAWIELDNRTSMRNDRSYGAFARKFDNYWVLPSVLGLDKRVAPLSVERIGRWSIPLLKDALRVLRDVPVLGKLFIGPLGWLSEEIWVYKWYLNMGYQEDSGTFWLVYPTSYFTDYDTRYVPTTDGGISKLWARTLEDETANDVGEGRWEVYEDEIEQIRRGYLRATESASTSRYNQSKVSSIASRLSAGEADGFD